MAESMVTVQNLSKSYGDFSAVRSISFDLRRGEIFGLLGPNGAGKTTTLECLEGIRRADAGSLSILGVDPGKDPLKLRNLIGVQLQTSGLPPEMTVDEALKLFSAYHGVAPRFDLLDRLGLKEKRKAQYRSLSVGLQRRLTLALAIAHHPPVLFLDEPTAGLDVGSRVELHTLMEELKEQGVSILLATHDMAEAEKLSDRVAILLGGKIVTTGIPREITATGSGLTKVSVSTEQSILLHSPVALPGVQQQNQKEDYAIYFTTDPGATVSSLLETIKQKEDKLIDLRVERPSLEERFLEITQNGEKA